MNQGLEAYFEKTDSHSRVSDMNVKELKNLVRQGEGTSLEFKLKATHPEKIIREIVAGFEPTQLATNTSPSVVDNNGGIKGKRPNKKDKLRALASAQNI